MMGWVGLSELHNRVRNRARDRQVKKEAQCSAD